MMTMTLPFQITLNTHVDAAAAAADDDNDDNDDDDDPTISDTCRKRHLSSVTEGICTIQRNRVYRSTADGLAECQTSLTAWAGASGIPLLLH